MTQVITKKQIEDIINKIDGQMLIQLIEQGFIAYSDKKVIVPPVGYLGFSNPSGDVHIKYGYIQEDKYYVVKIASGFYDNPQINLPSGNGVMLVFSQKTGELLSILLDEGYLTDIRTALAGAVAAKHLAPKKINAIGIVGTGTQAKLQLHYLKYITECRKAIVWGRSKENLDRYSGAMKDSGFAITTTEEIQAISNNCNLIVTTTPSRKPLIEAIQVRPGTHITAVGADSKGKQELDPKILQNSDIIVTDSTEQCIDHGEIAYAIERKLIDVEKVIELGAFIKAGQKRVNDQQVTIADLTGVAIQDIQIAKIVHEAIK